VIDKVGFNYPKQRLIKIKVMNETPILTKNFMFEQIVVVVVVLIDQKIKL